MIGSVRDRATFHALSRRASTFRADDLEVRVVFDFPRHSPAPPVRLAFAIGRAIGPAVVRNRLRRRLRAIVAACAAEPGGVPAGAYLFIARPGLATVDFAELRSRVTTVIDAVRTVGPAS